MVKFEDGYKKTMAPNRNYQYYTHEWYDSEFEGNSMAFLKLLGGLEIHSQGLAFTVPFVSGGRYKPDGWYTITRDGDFVIGTAKVPLVLLEIKGWKGREDGKDDNGLKRGFMKMLVDDPGDEVVGAYWQMKDSLKILGYDGEGPDWEPAAIYVCPHCAHSFYAVNTRRTCPYCRNVNTRFVTDTVNGSFRHEWEDVSDKYLQRMSELTAQGVRFDPNAVWNQVIHEKEQAYRRKLYSRDDIEFKSASIAPELEKVDFKALVRNAYSIEGKDN